MRLERLILVCTIGSSDQLRLEPYSEEVAERARRLPLAQERLRLRPEHARAAAAAAETAAVAASRAPANRAQALGRGGVGVTSPRSTRRSPVQPGTQYPGE